MKTTVEIPDDLYQRLRVVIAEQHTSLRAVLEDALRRVLDERERRPRGITRDASYGTGGLNPEFAAGGWEAIRDAIHEGRGA